MATVTQRLDPDGAQFLSTTFPQYIKAEGTNFPVAGLHFDAASQENAYWQIAAINYGTGNWTFKIRWYAATATSGVVRWGVQVAAITGNTDSGAVTSKAFDTATEGNDTHLGTTATRMHSVDIVVSNLDSVAAGDDVWIKVYRDTTDAADTMAGDAVIIGVDVSYSDT